MALRCSHLCTSLRNIVSRAVKKVLRNCSSQRLACSSPPPHVRSPRSLISALHVLSLCRVSPCLRRELEMSTFKCTYLRNGSTLSIRALFLLSQLPRLFFYTSEERANHRASEIPIYHNPTLKISGLMIIHVFPRKFGIWSSARLLP